jgi:NADPH:quinone reductase-like Zn-dependent oxidoreductase
MANTTWTALETMKAVRIHAYGGPEVLVYEDIPRPEPKAGEVLVRVHASGVNPVDWKIREGYLKGMLHYHLPLVLGSDGSGTVEAAGVGVTRLKMGVQPCDQERPLDEPFWGLKSYRS